MYLHIVPKEISCYDYDKYYVGITKNIKKRWECNGINYRDQKFYRAIRKYGWNNIRHVILYENLTKEQACDLEQEKIKELHSNTPKYGYNMDSGGIVSDYRGIPIAQYTLGGAFIKAYENAALAARINGWNLVLTKSKTSHGFQWVQNINYEFPTQISPVKKRKCLKVLQYSLNGAYIQSYEDINSSFGKRKADHIRTVCIGNKITAYGFQWKYENSDKTICDVTSIAGINQVNLSGDKENCIFMYDLFGNFIKGFCRKSDAGKYINKKGFKLPHRVFNHIQNNELYGYRWTNNYYKNLPPLYKIDLHRKPVLQMDVNNNVIDIHLSVIDAAKKLNKRPASIESCCKKHMGNKNRLTSYGYKWNYLTDVKIEELQISDSFLLQKIKDMKSILNTLV